MTLGEAVLQGIEKYLSEAPEACLDKEYLRDEIEFALNNELGVAANEAAKAERRRVAVVKYLATSSMRLTREQMDQLIKEAQG